MPRYESKKIAWGLHYKDTLLNPVQYEETVTRGIAFLIGIML